MRFTILIILLSGCTIRQEEPDRQTYILIQQMGVGSHIHEDYLITPNKLSKTDPFQRIVVVSPMIFDSLAAFFIAHHSKIKVTTPKEYSVFNIAKVDGPDSVNYVLIDRHELFKYFNELRSRLNGIDTTKSDVKRVVQGIIESID